MKKIMILDTSVGTLNTGDEIINSSIQKNWTELYDSNYIYRYPTHTPPHSWWQQLFFGHRLNGYKDADYKFLCGTNALYTNMVRPLPVWNTHLLNAGIYEGTILLGVGAGINSKTVNLYTRKLYNKVLNHEYIHSVRDEYTKEMLEKLGFRVMNTGCPTLWGLTPEHCAAIPTTKAKDVVFTLTGYHADRANDKAMVDALKRNYEKLYFWPQTLSDLLYLQSLGADDFEVIAPNLSAYDRMLDMDVDYVGNRLHGGIRALQHGRRSFIISIDYRAENMARDYSLPVISRERISEELYDAINKSEPTLIKGIDFDKIKQWKSQFHFVEEADNELNSKRGVILTLNVAYSYAA